MMIFGCILMVGCLIRCATLTDSCLFIPHPVVDYDRIKKVIAKVETAGHPDHYTLVNRFGYMGKYQFHKSTLKSLGFTAHEISIFLRSPKLQEKAMNKLITWNYNYFESQGLFECVGMEINCVKITKEGMLAGAHLVGALSVEHFMWYDGNMKTTKYKGVIVHKSDGNKTPLTRYMELFNN